ncbi:MAG: GNAT family N-acetyltransferase [Phycisphaerae bacterium]|nr:GNAT family N-acetyltransferase [Phycisphaerae bacterium]
MQESQRLAAVRRLVNQSGDREASARRLIAAAPAHGIDLDLMWATLTPSGAISQSCLAVLGAGRTAMTFLSEPGPEGDTHPAGALSERGACLDAACRELAHHPGKAGTGVMMAQGLPDPSEAWAIEAYRRAAFVHVGDLSYLRRAISGFPAIPEPAWPAGVSVAPIHQCFGDQGRERLAELLARTYEGTLDCPELCGLRDPLDVADSHMATGVFDPSLWLIVLDRGKAEGCVLLSRNPELRGVELVYFGFAPALRGRGLAAPLLNYAVGRCRAPGVAELTCAVDERNEPAKRLYERAGMRRFSGRVAFVRPLRGGAETGGSRASR